MVLIVPQFPSSAYLSTSGDTFALRTRIRFPAITRTVTTARRFARRGSLSRLPTDLRCHLVRPARQTTPDLQNTTPLAFTTRHHYNVTAHAACLLSVYGLQAIFRYSNPHINQRR